MPPIRRSIRLSRVRRHLLAAASLAALLAGCAPMTPPELTEKGPLREEAVNFLSEQPVIVLNSEPSRFAWGGEEENEPLPSTLVGPISASDMSALTLLELLLEPSGIALAPAPDFEDRRITLIDPKKRPLAETIDTIARNAGFFYSYKAGTLTVESSRRFFVRVPRIANSMDVIATAAHDFGARDVYPDRVTGSISFTADYRTFRQLQQFMRTFEEGRDQIVYDVWIFEVGLKSGKKVGIDWKKAAGLFGNQQFSIFSENTAAAPGKSLVGDLGKIGLGLLANSTPFQLDLFIDFIEAQGNTKTLARPTVTLMSGGTAEFFNGETQSYIRNLDTDVAVGAVLSSSTSTSTTSTSSGVTDSGASSSLSPTTNNTTTNTTNNPVSPASFVRGTSGTDVQDLKTGISLKLEGSYTDGIIHTNLELKIDDLLKFDTFKTGAGENFIELSLPHTSNRLLRTAMDARPGDVLVIGGIIKEKAEIGSSGIAETDIDLQRSRAREQAETVMLLRPRLVKIRPKRVEETNVPHVGGEKAAAAAASP